MDFYIKHLDLLEGESVKAVIHVDDLNDLGADIKGKVIITCNERHLIADILSTKDENLVQVGYIGISLDSEQKVSFAEGERVQVDVLQRPESLDFLVQKMKGEELDASRIDKIVNDIVNGVYRGEEIAYFVGSMINPGFTEGELVCLVRSMVSTGDSYDFTKLGKPVIDKHSTGGVAGKGITPIVISLLANYDVILPNTSTKTITSANATSNMLQSVMNIELNGKEMFDTVKKCNAMLVWGGYLKLAPL